MSGGTQHPTFNVANRERVAVRKKPVELTAIRCEVGQVEYAFEYLLHRRYLCTYCGLSAELLLQVRCTAQVVGMDMRFENPVDGECVFIDVFDKRVGRRRRRPPGCCVVVEHRVDDGGTARGRVTDNVGHCKRCIVKERFHIGSGHDGLRPGNGCVL